MKNMFEILKDTLQNGMEIKNERELSNKWKFSIAYDGMQAATELPKTTAPGHEVEVCKSSINNAMSTMYINVGNLVEAKAWLDGEKWKEEKKIVTRTITLTEEEIECFNAYIESEKVDVAFGNTDWCSVYHKIVGDKVSDYAKDKMDLYQL